MCSRIYHTKPSQQETSLSVEIITTIDNFF